MRVVAYVRQNTSRWGRKARTRVEVRLPFPVMVAQPRVMARSQFHHSVVVILESIVDGIRLPHWVCGLVHALHCLGPQSPGFVCCVDRKRVR